jgi:hypothetical protein
MRRILVIAGLLTTALSSLGQTVGVESYIGDTQERAGLLKFQTGTLNRVFEADLAAFNTIGPTNSTHLDLPHTVFEDQIGAAPPFMRMGSSKFQTRHTRQHSRRHYRRLRHIYHSR